MPKQVREYVSEEMMQETFKHLEYAYSHALEMGLREIGYDPVDRVKTMWRYSQSTLKALKGSLAVQDEKLEKLQQQGQVELTEVKKDAAFLQWLGKNCKIVFWREESEGSATVFYPIEHNPHANKDGLLAIRDWYETYGKGE